MNPNLCRVVLRPRNPMEVFDLGWRILARHAAVFMRLSAVVVLPLWLVSVGVGWATDWHWGVAIALWALAGAARAPFTLLAGRLMFAEHVRARDVLGECLGRLPGLVGMNGVHLANLVAGALTCGASLLPGLAALVWTPECLLLEQRRDSVRQGGLVAARRSWHLVSQGGAAAIAGTAATVFLAMWFAAVGEATGAVCTEFLLQFGRPFGSPMAFQATPWMLFGLLAAQPVIGTYRLLLYVDTRTRAEGWDLQVGLRAMGLDP